MSVPSTSLSGERAAVEQIAEDVLERMESIRLEPPVALVRQMLRDRGWTSQCGAEWTSPASGDVYPSVDEGWMVAMLAETAVNL